jgi:hypothetical protein
VSIAAPEQTPAFRSPDIKPAQMGGHLLQPTNHQLRANDMPDAEAKKPVTLNREEPDLGDPDESPRGSIRPARQWSRKNLPAPRRAVSAARLLGA